MPIALERELKKRAREKGFTQRQGKKTILSERGRAYIYGTLRNTGWKPSREKA